MITRVVKRTKRTSSTGGGGQQLHKVEIFLQAILFLVVK